MDISLIGKHAIVCGASQGIGLAAAKVMSHLGATLTLVARNVKSLEAAVATLQSAAEQNHQYIAADFSDPVQVAAEISGRVNNLAAQILVNNTGGPPGGAAHTAGVDEYQDAFNKHLLCNQLITQAVLPGMRESGYGRIINIISTSVKQPIPGLGVSNTIRGAVASWAKTLASELGADGITVNNVLPGFTRTGRLDSIISDRALESGKTEHEITQGMLATVPAGRFADAEEVGNAVAFLASPAAAYINGINVPVDGGRTESL